MTTIMNNQKQIVIGIAGPMGAGKGTVTTYLMQQYHALNLRYSGILQDILRRLDLPYQREALADLAEALRTTFGADVLSRALVGDVQRSHAAIVVIDGIRKKDELDVLRTLPGFVFVYVDAPLELRYERIHQRDEKIDDRTKTFEEFVADQQHAADRDVPTLRQYADHVIDNRSGYDDTHRQIDVVIAQIRTAV